MKKAAGFTLLEVLVAIAITALVAVMAYGGFSTAMDAGEQSIDAAEHLQELDRTLRILERDLMQTVPRAIVDGYGEPQPAFEGMAAGDLASGRAGRYALRFTRGGWSNPLQLPRSELQRVAYRLADGQLWRDHWPQLDMAHAEAPRRLHLLSGVVAMRLRYLGTTAGRKNALGGEWLEQWPANANANANPAQVAESLPAAVELILELEGWGEIRRLFPLPAAN